MCSTNAVGCWIVPKRNRTGPCRPVTSQTGELAATAEYAEMCLSSLVTWRSFATLPPFLTCHSVLWQLVGCPPPPLVSPILLLHLPGSLPVFLPYLSMRIGGSHFHASSAPVSVTAPCPPVSLEAASLVWEAAGEAIGVQLSTTWELWDQLC